MAERSVDDKLEIYWEFSTQEFRRLGSAKQETTLDIEDRLVLDLETAYLNGMDDLYRFIDRGSGTSRTLQYLSESSRAAFKRRASLILERLKQH